MFSRTFFTLKKTLLKQFVYSYKTPFHYNVVHTCVSFLITKYIFTNNLFDNMKNKSKRILLS